MTDQRGPTRAERRRAERMVAVSLRAGRVPRGYVAASVAEALHFSWLLREALLERARHHAARVKAQRERRGSVVTAFPDIALGLRNFELVQQVEEITEKIRSGKIGVA